MHRFFIDENLILNNHGFLSEEDSLHAIKVLRLKENDFIVVCDANGYDFDARIESVSKYGVELELSNERKSETESDVKVTLIQCLPKSGKMEVIIQKCVELGVYNIVPVVSQRSVVKVNDSKKNKIERYNRISYEAAKQSRRGIIPRVFDITELSNIDFSQFDCLLVPYEEEKEVSLKQLFETDKRLASADKIAVVIGPEGGISKEEIDFLRAKNGITLTLGKRILRTETAGMATLAMLFCLLEG